MPEETFKLKEFLCNFLKMLYLCIYVSIYICMFNISFICLSIDTPCMQEHMYTLDNAWSLANIFVLSYFL